jgi:hypothetical protein
MSLSANTGERIRASSTVYSAFSDLFNLFMTIPAALLFLLCLFLTLRLGIRPDLIFFAAITGLWLFIYIRAILNREIEVSDDGITYREASIHLHFPWKEIEAIKVEHWKKQITIWRGGKLRRIHEFGLPKSQLDAVRAALQRHINQNNIPIR